jgi:hypothetical protein
MQTRKQLRGGPVLGAAVDQAPGHQGRPHVPGFPDRSRSDPASGRTSRGALDRTEAIPTEETPRTRAKPEQPKGLVLAGDAVCFRRGGVRDQTLDPQAPGACLVLLSEELFTEGPSRGN